MAKFDKILFILFYMIVPASLFAQTADESAVGAQRPIAYLMNSFEIRAVSADQKKIYCDKISKDLMLLKTSKVLPSNSKISSRELQEMGDNQVEWKKMVAKVVAACGAPENKKACDTLANDRQYVLEKKRPGRLAPTSAQVPLEASPSGAK